MAPDNGLVQAQPQQAPDWSGRQNSTAPVGDTSGSAPAPKPLLKSLWRWAELQPRKKALSFIGTSGEEEECLSYSALASRAVSIASHLTDVLGMERGDTALLVYPSSLEFVASFLACLCTGVIAVPVFPPDPVGARKDMSMFTSIVASSGARVALTSKDYHSVARIADLRSSFQRWFGEDKSWPNVQWVVTDGIGTQPSGASWSAVPEVTQPDQVAFLQYTSGSTSEPKGVAVTHGNLAHNLSFITGVLKADSDTVVVSWLPQYHDMGLIGSYLGTVYCGGSGVYMCPKTFVRNPTLWPRLISRHRGTHLQAPNFAYSLVARKWMEAGKAREGGAASILSGPEWDIDLSCVKHMINAAEPVDAGSMDTFYSVFERHGLKRGVIFPTYGLAEHTVCVCSNGTGHLVANRAELEEDGRLHCVEKLELWAFDVDKSVLGGSDEGVPVVSLVSSGNLVEAAAYGVEVCIVEEVVESGEGEHVEVFRALPDSHVGEIWVRSPSKASGYWGLLKTTERDFNGSLEGKGDGFLRTGDLGLIHESELYVTGRLKDLVIIRGRNHYPQDIERTAEQSAADGVLRRGTAAAFSVRSSGRSGAETLALVVEVASLSLSRELCADVVGDIRRAVASEHGVDLCVVSLLAPRTVPKTTSGKIARAWCAKSFATGTLQVVHAFSKAQTGWEPDVEGKKPVTNHEGSAPPCNAASMTDAQVLDAIVAEMARVVKSDVTEIPVDEPLCTLGLDSMEGIQLLSLLEERFSIKIPEAAMMDEETTLKSLIPIVRGHGVTPPPRAFVFDSATIAAGDCRDVIKGFETAEGLEKRRAQRAGRASTRSMRKTGSFAPGTLVNPCKEFCLLPFAARTYWIAIAILTVWSPWLAMFTCGALAVLAPYWGAVAVALLVSTSAILKRVCARNPAAGKRSKLRLRLLQLSSHRIILEDELAAHRAYIFMGDGFGFISQMLFSHSMPGVAGVRPRPTTAPCSISWLSSFSPLSVALTAFSAGCDDPGAALARGESVIIDGSDIVAVQNALKMAATTGCEIIPCVVAGVGIASPHSVICGVPSKYHSAQQVREEIQALRQKHLISLSHQ